MITLAAWRKLKSESFFLFAFLNTVMLIFCLIYLLNIPHTQPAFTCSKLTIETLEQGVKYV